jgi:PAS domain S-box-containing protein
MYRTDGPHRDARSVSRLMKLLDALRRVADRLAPGSWEWGSADALATLAAAAEIDRAWVFEHRFLENDVDAVPFRSWAVLPRLEEPVTVRGLSGRWLELTRSGDALIRGAGTSSWYGDRVLERFGLEVSIVVPILVEARAWGFIAFGPASEGWTPAEAEALRAAAAVFASAIARDRRDRALGEASERYQALVEEIPAITYIDRPDPASPTGYRPVFFSPQSTSMLGYTPGELEGRPDVWIELLHADDREVALAADAAHHATGDPLAHEYRLVARNGRTVWIRDQARMIRDAHGNPKFSLGVLLDITDRKLAEAKLTDAMDALAKSDRLRRALFARLVTVEEQERARIARTIHDDSIQYLASVAIGIEVLRARTAGLGLEDDIDRLTGAVRTAIVTLRDLLTELRPPLLDTEGLEAAVRSTLDQLAAEAGVASSLRAELSEEPPVDVAVILYRVVQEALMNVRKHADATRVQVVLASDRDGVSLTVTDNGKGFDTTENRRPGHLGLAGMRERAELAGGWFEIESVPDGGTTVRAWFPIEDDTPRTA